MRSELRLLVVLGLAVTVGLTLALVGITAGVDRARRRRGAPAPEIANPRSHYE